MNRPLTDPYDPGEEVARRREYAQMLDRLSLSEFTNRCDPEDDKGYPAQIFRWQYATGLIAPDPFGAALGSAIKRRPKDALYIRERRFELARQLAISLVADGAGTSPETVRKLCRKFEPNYTGTDGDDV